MFFVVSCKKQMAPEFLTPPPPCYDSSRQQLPGYGSLEIICHLDIRNEGVSFDTKCDNSINECSIQVNNNWISPQDMQSLD